MSMVSKTRPVARLAGPCAGRSTEQTCVPLADRPRQPRCRELDGTDISGAENVGAVEFTTSTPRCSGRDAHGQVWTRLATSYR
ncbi:MAG: hypothetical protein WAN20_18815 [Pseudonocardiaceae bacterium]